MSMSTFIRLPLLFFMGTFLTACGNQVAEEDFIYLNDYKATNVEKTSEFPTENPITKAKYDQIIEQNVEKGIKGSTYQEVIDLMGEPLDTIKREDGTMEAYWEYIPEGQVGSHLFVTFKGNYVVKKVGMNLAADFH